MEPLVSVICITRNHERFCVESLDSILNQTYKNLEWIILDAASTDSTPEIIENWLVQNDIRALFIKENNLKPITVNLNKAFKYASGEYIQFLSLDDVLERDKINLQVNEFMKLDKSYVCIHTDSIGINESNEIICESAMDWYKNNVKREIISLEGGMNLFKELCLGNCTSMLTMLFKIEAINAIGGFDEKLSYEDHDLNLRLSRIFKYKYLNIKSVKYRLHSNNLHKNKVSFFQIRDEVLMFYKHLDTKFGRKAFYKKLKHLLRKTDNIEELKYIGQNTKIPYILLYSLKIIGNIKFYLLTKISKGQI